ncbi:MAG: YbgC/FadM family acyl-CoA thioesterase [Candidatus Omnitrophica bacterium]|nr:YbgC/FadM family acyl-CoA thioesterase [Candidatus Omnitrophota bacterium]
MKKRIYYHDTDCGGVVYYSNYLKYMEEARTEYFAQRGLSIKELSGEGTMFVIARVEIDYKFPAFYGDTLDIETVFVKVHRVKIEVEHTVKNQNNKVICQSKTLMVCVDKNIEPKAIPDDVMKRLGNTPR